MPTITRRNGRLGNQIIRNLSVSLIAQKFNLKVDYFNKDLISKLGINLFSGDNDYENTILLTDDNYFEVYNSENVINNLNSNNNYFQTKSISHFLYSYLHQEPIKLNII